MNNYLNDENINEIVQILEENACDDQWTLIEIKESTPLICAIENKIISILLNIFMKKEQISIYLSKNRLFIIVNRPLRVSCKHGHKQIVDYLFQLFIIKNVSICCREKCSSSSLSLCYENPDRTSVEYLSIGNGSLGGMISGGYPRETIQLNIDT